MTTNEEEVRAAMAELASALVIARVQRVKHSKCPEGVPHKWSFRRSPDGVGQYTCTTCGFRCSKAELKRWTDRDTIEVTI